MSVDWPGELKRMEELVWGEPILIGVLPGEAVQWTATAFRGPEDEPDLEANGDPSSINGEESEEGFDDMPLECGWEDEGESDEDDGADDADDDC